MRTYFRLQSSIITLFDVKIGRFIANHSFQFARKSVIANIISIETAGQMLGARAFGPTKAHTHARARLLFLPKHEHRTEFH